MRSLSKSLKSTMRHVIRPVCNQSQRPRDIFRQELLLHYWRWCHRGKPGKHYQLARFLMKMARINSIISCTGYSYPPEFHKTPFLQYQGVHEIGSMLWLCHAINLIALISGLLFSKGSFTSKSFKTLMSKNWYWILAINILCSYKIRQTIDTIYIFEFWPFCM